MRLGPWYYWEQSNEEFFCNIYSPEAATRMWSEKAEYADLAADWMKYYPQYDYRNILFLVQQNYSYSY